MYLHGRPFCRGRRRGDLVTSCVGLRRVDLEAHSLCDQRGEGVMRQVKWNSCRRQAASGVRVLEQPSIPPVPPPRRHTFDKQLRDDRGQSQSVHLALWQACTSLALLQPRNPLLKGARTYKGEKHQSINSKPTRTSTVNPPAIKSQEYPVPTVEYPAGTQASPACPTQRQCDNTMEVESLPHGPQEAVC
ncbi:hypothetical protein C0Q70_17161 [Pomacea canaliculata]|uniref:Uncharacterized protein n=1 Tax=Pomacea canaliculata TaxID=400727 RepID=A0A2T7NRV2_POMCA|nr:hypothetical protein C0Q70_17161 [Pomacea canaliculata]